MSGLSAAYELSFAGHEVTVLEAQNRPGGRVMTARNFDDGLHAEMGAEFINPHHEYSLKYINEFHLSITDPDTTESEIEGIKPPPGNEAVQEALHEAIKNIGPFGKSDTHLDSITFEQFMDEIKAGPELKNIMNRDAANLMGAEINQISALHYLNELALPHAEKDARIDGGNDQLPKAIAKKLDSKINYRCPVWEIVWTENNVKVICTKEREYTADYLIMTAPLPALRKIIFTPGLPVGIQLAINSIPYGSILKAPMQFKERFWAKLPKGPKSLSGGLGVIYEPTNTHPGPRSILTSYVPASSGREVAAIKHSKRMEDVLRRVTGTLPDTMEYYEKGTAMWWDENPWAGGIYAWFAPGQITGLKPLLLQQVGPIHFAGEHTADWQGYINGAIESAQRVAREIAAKCMNS